MLELARVILEVRNAASRKGILATVGKVQISPGAVNAIPGRASAWIDARGNDEPLVRAAIAELEAATSLRTIEESWTSSTVFDLDFTNEVAEALDTDLPRLPSGAGHDAGVLALAGIPSAMILVRNPSGISHAPEEFAEDADVERGVVALAAAIVSRCA
jgi:N-carbamoyl-L-amino-acid hydrolase